MAWLVMSCMPESWEHSLRRVWVWFCREGIGDRESESNEEREGDGECEGDSDREGEGIEAINVVGIDWKKGSTITCSALTFLADEILAFSIKESKISKSH